MITGTLSLDETVVGHVQTIIVDLPTTAAEDIRHQQMKDSDIQNIIDAFGMLSDAVDILRWTEHG